MIQTRRRPPAPSWWRSADPRRALAYSAASRPPSARSGEDRQAIALPEARAATAFQTLDSDATLEQIAGKRYDLPDRLGRLLVRREAVCVYPTLVWRPCMESLSPFYPFRMVTVGAHRLYVRIDGAVFTSLTTGQHGI